METEKLVEKLLNEGLELLSSEKKQKQKKALVHCGQLLVWVAWRFAYYEGICYKNGIGTYQSDEQAFERFEMAADAVPKAMFELEVYATFMELAQNRI